MGPREREDLVGRTSCGKKWRQKDVKGIIFYGNTPVKKLPCASPTGSPAGEPRPKELKQETGDFDRVRFRRLLINSLLLGGELLLGH